VRKTDFSIGTLVSVLTIYCSLSVFSLKAQKAQILRWQKSAFPHWDEME